VTRPQSSPQTLANSCSHSLGIGFVTPELARDHIRSLEGNPVNLSKTIGMGANGG
jgi:hypothetical protein